MGQPVEITRLEHSVSELGAIAVKTKNAAMARRLLALAATIAGADDFVEVTLWGQQHQDFLRRFFPYALGIPSHDTMCDVLAAIDPDLFKVCLRDWVKDLRDGAPELIAIDGKTSRGSHDHARGHK